MADTENLDAYPDRIADFMVGKTIFLTGGTGFVGKVLIEKMLRVFPDINKIIIMVRSKKGKHPQDRVREILNGPLYDMAKKQRGEDIIKKVVAIFGDVSMPGLGMCKEDREMITEEVDVIVHGAATIRFDEQLQKAVFLNVRGTKYMLELAKECKKLLVFAHLSTAYCHLSERILYEKAYPPPANPHHVIKTCEWLSEEVIDKITPKILGDIPNSYAFTKALGEGLVVEQFDNIPVIILRPPVVIPIWMEPIPGWTDNINGPTGLLIGAGKGVLRSMYCRAKSYADYLPVDILANCIILCIADYIEHKGQRRIYNLTSSSEYKVTMEEIIEMGRKIVEKRMPLNGVAWYPGGSIKNSKIYHYICFFLFHIIPALFVDLLLVILGYKPVLIRVQKRIWKGFQVFEYYTTNQWDFNNDESLRCRKLLNPRERQLYKCDGDGVDYYEYFTDCVHAARLYILKETDDTLPAARRHMFVMWCVDRVFRTFAYLGLLYLLYSKVLAPILGI